MGHFAKAQSYGNGDLVSEFNTVNVVPFPVRATGGPASSRSISTPAGTPAFFRASIPGYNRKTKANDKGER